MNKPYLQALRDAYQEQMEKKGNDNLRVTPMGIVAILNAILAEPPKTSPRRGKKITKR